jgi:hypothetical protein
MLLPEHKYLIEKVDLPQNTKDNQFRFQTIVLKKPGYTDEFGEKIGKDDLLECKVWNDKIEQMPVLKAGDKVKAVLNLNGRQGLDRNNSEIYYTLNLSIKNIELL